MVSHEPFLRSLGIGQVHGPRMMQRKKACLVITSLGFWKLYIVPLNMSEILLASSPEGGCPQIGN